MELDPSANLESCPKNEALNDTSSGGYKPCMNACADAKAATSGVEDTLISSLSRR
jgi:hypothetical protein